MKLVYFDGGNESDVVISSRVRLARNLKNIPFPHNLSSNEGKRVINIIKKILVKEGQNYEFIDVSTLRDVDLYALVEMHLISPEFVQQKNEKGIIINDQEIISIMINEEDHVRIQCISSGLELENTYKKCEIVDNEIERIAKFAFNEKYGYLTSCPTNIGTGMRVSAMLHLPALTITGHIGGILENCSKFGLAIRGLYGENTKALGNIFQISNQVTLGQTEMEIISNVNSIIMQIVNKEKHLRNELYNENRYIFEDRVYRSLGIFKNARMLNIEESFKLISDIKLGVEMNIIKEVDIEKINKIMVLMQPANLNIYMDNNPEIEEKLNRIDDINVIRASLVKKLL